MTMVCKMEMFERRRRGVKIRLGIEEKERIF
jgi:hypothetical protein